MKSTLAAQLRAESLLTTHPTTTSAHLSSDHPADLHFQCGFYKNKKRGAGERQGLGWGRGLFVDWMWVRPVSCFLFWYFSPISDCVTAIQIFSQRTPKIQGVRIRQGQR